MKPSIDNLRGLKGRRVAIRSTEGEVMTATIHDVYEEGRDIVCEIHQTSQPERYAGRDPGTWYAMPWQFIEDIAPE